MFPNRGAFVTTPDEDSREQMLEVYGFMFGLAARLASSKISETDMARLERMVIDLFSDTRLQSLRLFRVEG